MKLMTRGAAKRLAVFAIIAGAGLVIAWWVMIRMPGSSYDGPLPPADAIEEGLARRIARDVQVLAGDIGVRNRFARTNYEKAAEYIEAELRSLGYEPARQPCPPYDPSLTPGNIWCERKGTKPERIVIVGAHYDSYSDSPGANDNATGVAAVLALAERFAAGGAEKTLRFVFFADEEPPQFQTEAMGSLVYARHVAEQGESSGESIEAMISVETIGWYSDETGSQKYPRPLDMVYPSRGNFVGLVSNVSSRALLHEVIASFRDTTKFPSEGGALPSVLPGISWSDHWAFWQTGVPALMATDTAPFRYPHYHTPEDTPDKVDPERMARVVRGLEHVLRHLTNGPQK